MPRLAWLEDRLLLSAISAEALPLVSGTTVNGTIAPFGATFYQIAADAVGKLTVALMAVGFQARVSLVDPLGKPLVESDGATIGAGTSAIDVNVAAGSDYLEVESLGGTGTYQLSATLTPTDAPFQPIPSLYSNSNQLAEGDFNGDKIPDLVVPEGLHLGTGDGTFLSTDPSGPLGTPGWLVTAIAVINDDGDALPEIAYTQTSPDETSAQLCVVQVDSGEQLQQVVCLPFEPGIDYPDPTAIQTIDFGGGLAGLAVADPSTGNVVIYTGNGSGSYTSSQTLEGLDVPVALLSGRFGDGYVDLIVADNGDTSEGDNGGLVVFQASEDDQFQLAGTVGAGSGPSAIVAGDFTGDGLLDLAVADENSGDVSILINNGNGTFQFPSSYAVGSAPEAIVACDFGNGHVDLATANNNSNDVSILMGNGDGTFGSQLRFAAGPGPASLIACDLNGDGRADLVVGDQDADGGGTGEITILLGRGDGTFQDPVADPVGDDPAAEVTADLTNNGHLDVITSNYYTNDISVLMGNGDGTFLAARSFPAGVAPQSLVLGDFNGDGILDLAVADRGADGSGAGVSILMGNGDGTFQSPMFYPTGLDPSSIVAGRFTAGDVLDLAVANQGGDSVSILLGSGAGGFITQPPIDLGDDAGGPKFLTVGNFGNGEVDLAVANDATDNVSVLMGDGQGNFRVLPPIPLGTAAQNQPSAMVSGAFFRREHHRSRHCKHQHRRRRTS